MIAALVEGNLIDARLQWSGKQMNGIEIEGL
jgi:hypothetical protein